MKVNFKQVLNKNMLNALFFGNIRNYLRYSKVEVWFANI